MQTLDRKRPYGTITPPWNGDNDEFDRPVKYDQDGKLFDIHGLEVVRGNPAKVKRVAAPVVEEAPVDNEDDDDIETDAPAPVAAAPVAPPAAPIPSPADLLARAPTMAYAKLTKEAKRVLGPACPAGKPAIIAALEAAAKVYAVPTPPPAPPAAPYSGANGMTWSGQPGATAGELDLAAWGRGQKEYLFAEVRKAIRTKFGRTIAGEHERTDAVDFLIEAKVITAAEARKDV